jgi:hypothetical protein
MRRTNFSSAEQTSQQPARAGAQIAMSKTDNASAVERIYFAWDKALSENDPAALLALYAKDATVESPLVPYLMGTEKGICRGHEELRPLFEKVAKRKPKVRQYFRTGYLTDGKKLMWEYPQSGPEGEQMDFVEVMELNDEGLIQKHRVYWGWFGVGVLQRDDYYR